MARPQTFSKKENEKKKQARRLEKQNRKEERKLSGNTNSFEDMIAYVDENGRITSTPPETNHKKEEINHEEIVISTPRQESPEVRKGRVEYFNVSKGYGFIKDLSGTEKYFFHVSNALSELVENAIVIFDLERGKRGMNAINICISIHRLFQIKLFLATEISSYKSARPPPERAVNKTRHSPYACKCRINSRKFIKTK